VKSPAPLLRGRHHTVHARYARQQPDWPRGCRAPQHLRQPARRGAGAVCRGLPAPPRTGTAGRSGALRQGSGSRREDGWPVFLPQRPVSGRAATCAHAGVVAGTATVSSTQSRDASSSHRGQLFLPVPLPARANYSPEDPACPAPRQGQASDRPAKSRWDAGLSPAGLCTGLCPVPHWLGFKALIYVTILKQK